MAYFDRMGQPALVRKFNPNHDEKGRFALHEESHPHGSYRVEHHGAGVHAVMFTPKRARNARWVATGSNLEIAKAKIAQHIKWQSEPKSGIYKFNLSHDDRGRFSSADSGAGPDRRAEMANTQDRHLKASRYHYDRRQLYVNHNPDVAEMHLKASQFHMRAAVSGTYDDRRLARDTSVAAHAVEDAHRPRIR